MTNGDKIRAMSDEALCQLALRWSEAPCPLDRTYRPCSIDTPCDICIMDWLKAEVTSDVH